MGVLDLKLIEKVPHATDLVISRVRERISTFIAYGLCRWWGVRISPNVRFYGLPIMRRHPLAKITLGRQSQYRSGEWSNTIGINRRCVISARKGARISVGENCGFSGVVISASSSISIGDRVLCGANCTIVDNDRHPIDPVARAENAEAEAIPVRIEDDVFLSMNVVVLKGCSIGRATVVAANSVVTTSLPSGVIAGGVPARVIRKI